MMIFSRSCVSVALLLMVWSVSLRAQSPLPDWVYDQIADTNISVINMPQGTFTLRNNFEDILRINRSNLTINFKGCTLAIDFTQQQQSDTIYVISESQTTPKYPPSFESDPDRRYISHATGTITPATTTLTMHPDEVVAFNVGETVLIWAGVTPSDPVNPAVYLPATVQSVDVGTRVVTFTAPLNYTIPDYVNAAGLQAATDPGYWWKIGDWGIYVSDGSDFSKGYGTDHGIERFVGGLTHDVTINDLTIAVDAPLALADMPSPFNIIYTTSVQRLTFNNLTVTNPHGNVFLSYKSFDVLINGVTVSGTGSGEIFGGFIFHSVPFGIWGGNRILFRNVSISGTDIGLWNTEVSAENVQIENLTYDVEMTATRTWASQSVVMQNQATIGDPRVTNASLDLTHTGGSGVGYLTFDPTKFQGLLTFPGTSLTGSLDLGYQQFHDWSEASVRINSVTYGPSAVSFPTFAVQPTANFRDWVVPAGLYTTLAQVRITTMGDIRQITDSFGNTYCSDTGTPCVVGTWMTLASNHWHQIPAGAVGLAAYVGKSLRIWQHNMGSVEVGAVQLAITSLPECAGTCPPRKTAWMQPR